MSNVSDHSPYWEDDGVSPEMNTEEPPVKSYLPRRTEPTEAIRYWRHSTVDDIEALVPREHLRYADGCVYLKQANGKEHKAEVLDYIVKGKDGHCYPVPTEMFENYFAEKEEK